MTINVNDIADYQPQMAKIESGTEPSLRHILETYYTDHGISEKQAKELAHTYFQSIAIRFGLAVK